MRISTLDDRHGALAAPSPARESDEIAGVYVVPLRAFGDDRGFFFESFRRSWIPGVPDMVQGNVSFSKAGVLRGMHYHLKQADFWLVPSGHVSGALYDLRRPSPTHGRAQMLDLGDAYPFGVYIPAGVAHGFHAVTDSFMTYLVDQYYDNTDERGIRWNDPDLGLRWDVRAPIVSARDSANPLLADVPPDALPR